MAVDRGRHCVLLLARNPFRVNREACFVATKVACSELESGSGVQPCRPLVSRWWSNEVRLNWSMSSSSACLIYRTLEGLRGWDCLTIVWATDLRVRAVTPLAVLLRLGSCPTYPSRKRAVHLLGWLGFNALIGSTGALNNTWEGYSKLSCMIALRTLRATSFA